MPRALENGDVSLPAGFAFVIKKVNSFNPNTCIAEVAMTQILKVKCTNLKYKDAVMKELERSLRARYNEAEVDLIADKGALIKTAASACR